MAEKERPLPTPPRSRFGRDAREDADPAASLTSDRMALAAAEGRLEEFLRQELPEGEHARNLAMMMMGMSGMMPPDPPGEQPRDDASPEPPAPADDARPGASASLPPEILAAIQRGDVNSLTEILRAEHAKRSGRISASGDAAESPAAQATAASAHSPAGACGERRAGIDAAIIDDLMRIAAANDVTVDWLMLRAVKLYVEEYRKTGRL